MRFLITTVAVLAFIYAALALYAHQVKKGGMFFPERYPAGYWTLVLPVPFEEVYFSTPDGLSLHAWLFRAADPAAPLMLWFHGNAGNLTYRGPMASQLARRGMSVLVFDYRGFGRSQGRPSEAALHVDSLAAYDFVRSTLQPDSGRIVFYGESIGAPYAARVATLRPACCVILETPFPSLRRLANALYRPIPMGWFAGDLLQTTRWLDQAGVPVLVMHGKRDQVIPFHLGVEVYESLKVDKELFVSETAAHSEIEMAEGERFYDAVSRFVNRHCMP